MRPLPERLVRLGGCCQFASTRGGWWGMRSVRSTERAWLTGHVHATASAHAQRGRAACIVDDHWIARNAIRRTLASQWRSGSMTTRAAAVFMELCTQRGAKGCGVQGVGGAIASGASAGVRGKERDGAARAPSRDGLRVMGSSRVRRRSCRCPWRRGRPCRRAWGSCPWAPSPRARPRARPRCRPTGRA